MVSARKLSAVGVALLAVLCLGAIAHGGQRFEARKRAKWDGPTVVPGEVIVKFRRGTASAAGEQVLSRHGASEVEASPFAGFKRVSVPAGKTMAETLAALRKDLAVEYAEPNTICRAFMTPNDPYYPYQWHLSNATYGGINIGPAWDHSTGAGVIVAILDTGVAYETYKDAKTKKWYYKAPDLAGTSFVAGYDFVNNDSHPNDDNAHGTHVAGTIAQTTNNATGCAGVAFGCSIMPVKVLNASGSGTAATLANGLYYAADHGAKVINMSLGWPVDATGAYDPGQTVRDAIAYAYGKGVTIVCAAGNDGQPFVAYPAAYDQYCIAVGATRYDETRASYSNYGSSLDITAPGGDLSVDQNGDGYGDGVLQNTFASNNVASFGYYFYDGTSMATPHVAGVAALLIASGVTGPDAVRAKLLATAEDKGAPGWDAEYGAGIVNAAAAFAPDGPVITIASVTPDTTSVARYARLELTVAMLNVAATKPYEADPALGGLNLSATFSGPGTARTVCGFYDGAAWRIRFAPDATGSWSYSVAATDSSGTSNTVTGSFTCVASSYPGWARIDGHWLRFTNGSALFAVGHNTGWQSAVDQPDFGTMATNGENLLSFWIAQPWATNGGRAPIENATGGIGNYTQAACAYLDGIVANAEQAGIYLLPTIWSHGQLRDTGHPWGTGWWWNNAYNSQCSATDFFKTGSTGQWRYQKNFYRYLIARWGYSRALVGWVALCEAEGTSAYQSSPSDINSWCAAVRDYFVANDPFRNAGGKHPTTASKTDEASGISGAPSWNNGCDLRSCDSYLSKADNVAVAYTVATETRTMWGLNKPGFHAEFGAASAAYQPGNFHNGVWAGTAAGAATTPLLYCDGSNWPNITSNNMLTHMQCLAQFIGGLGYQGDPNLAPATLTLAPTSTRGWGMKLADRGYAWIQNTTGTMGGQTLTISGVTPGGYHIAWYDVWTDGAAAFATTSATVGGDGKLIATVPALPQADLACKFVPNVPPNAVADSYDATEDTLLTVAAPGVLGNDTDADGDSLTAALVTPPAHGALTLNANGSFTYTPDLNYNGTDTFTYTASDSMASSAPATVTLNVGPTNDPPVALDQSVTTPQDTPLAITLTATDVDGGALTYAVVAGPSHGTLSGTPPNVTYAPAAGYVGPDSFTFKANDGQADSNVATVSITVTAVNHPPVAQNQSVTTPEDTQAGVTLVATDADGNPLTYAIVGSPAHGALTGTPPNVTYTPAANYNGPDSFTFKANDGFADSNVATVSITVTPVNDPPVAVNDTATTTEGTPVTIAVLANDSDVDGDALTVTTIVQGSLGTAVVNPNQTVTYTPDPGSTGTDTFGYTISDGHGGIASATVTVTINPSGPTAVLSFAMSKSTYTSYWKATAAVTVKTPAGAVIKSATVQGQWSGAYTSGTVTATTNNQGKATFTSGSIYSSGTATFTVDKVTKSGQTYVLTGQTSGSIAGAPKSSR